MVGYSKHVEEIDCYNLINGELSHSLGRKRASFSD
jgi:hypothetical protein